MGHCSRSATALVVSRELEGVERKLIKNIHEVVLLISSILALGGGILAALWAYAKFILERGLLPSIQFDVDLTRVGQTPDKALVEIHLHIKNMGSATLVARKIRLVQYSLNHISKPHTVEKVFALNDRVDNSASQSKTSEWSNLGIKTGSCETVKQKNRSRAEG